MEGNGHIPIWQGQSVLRTNAAGRRAYNPEFKAWIVEQAYDYYAPPTPERKPEIDWVVRQFAKLDIQLEVRATDNIQFQDKIRKGKYQVFWLGWNADYPDAEIILFLLYGPCQLAGAQWSRENCCKIRPNKGDLPCFIESDDSYRLNIAYNGFKNTQLALNIANLLDQEAPVNLKSGFTLRTWSYKVGVTHKF